MFPRSTRSPLPAPSRARGTRSTPVPHTWAAFLIQYRIEPGGAPAVNPARGRDMAPTGAHTVSVCTGSREGGGGRRCLCDVQCVHAACTWRWAVNHKRITAFGKRAGDGRRLGCAVRPAHVDAALDVGMAHHALWVSVRHEGRLWPQSRAVRSASWATSLHRGRDIAHHAVRGSPRECRALEAATSRRCRMQCPMPPRPSAGRPRAMFRSCPMTVARPPPHSLLAWDAQLAR